jgi:hypothetical protein
MRRLAILLAIISAVGAIESIVFSETGVRIMQARGRFHRALITLSDWRAFLIGPLRLIQRTTSSGGGPWLNLSN